MAQLNIIDVNSKGVSSDGEDFSEVASPEAVNSGLMVNVPVVLRYPDGRLRDATQAMITQKGMDHLRRYLPLAARGPQGAA